MAKCVLQIQWNNPEDPAKGFQYLYLSNADYQSIAARSLAPALKANPITVNGKFPYYVVPNPESAFSEDDLAGINCWGKKM